MTIEYMAGTAYNGHSKIEVAQAEAGMTRIDRVTNRCTSAHIILTEDVEVQKDC